MGVLGLLGVPAEQERTQFPQAEHDRDRGPQHRAAQHQTRVRRRFMHPRSRPGDRDGGDPDGADDDTGKETVPRGEREKHGGERSTDRERGEGRRHGGQLWEHADRYARWSYKRWTAPPVRTWQDEAWQRLLGAMQELDARVDLDKKEPAEVAKEYLTETGLIKE